MKDGRINGKLAVARGFGDLQYKDKGCAFTSRGGGGGGREIDHLAYNYTCVNIGWQSSLP